MVGGARCRPCGWGAGVGVGWARKRLAWPLAFGPFTCMRPTVRRGAGTRALGGGEAYRAMGNARQAALGPL